MRLYMAHLMEKMRVDVRMFFRICHQWKFQRDMLVDKSVDDFNSCGEIPPYARDFIKHIQGEERCPAQNVPIAEKPSGVPSSSSSES